MIRIVNTRTKRTVTAKSGKDAALMARIELDRRAGLEIASATNETPTPGTALHTMIHVGAAS